MYKKSFNSIFFCTLLSLSGITLASNQSNTTNSANTYNDEYEQENTQNNDATKFFFYGAATAVAACVLVDYILFKINPIKPFNLSKFTSFSSDYERLEYLKTVANPSYFKVLLERLNLYNEKMLITGNFNKIMPGLTPIATNISQ